MNKNLFTRVGTQVLSLLTLALLYSSAQVWAHGGEDHSTDQSAWQSTEGSFSISGSGDVYELTVVYYAFEKGETVRLRLFVANVETNRPVSDATLSLTLTGPALDLELTPMPVEASPGVYGAEVTIPEDADYSFLVEISTSDEFDLFSIDGFSPPPLSIQEGEAPSSFSLMNYSTYLILGGYFLVAILAYTLGTRERAFRKSQPDEVPTEEL